MNIIALSLTGLMSCVSAITPSLALQSMCMPEDSLVLVEGHSPDHVGYSYGVVTGDGSYVLCSSLIVQEASLEGQHKMWRLIYVNSPFLGASVEAKVVLCDIERGLALVRVPWKGHPVLPMAESHHILDANEVLLLGMPELIGALAGDGDSVPDASALFSRCRLPVDYVALRQGVPQSVALLGLGHARANSGGEPMLSVDQFQILAFARDVYRREKKLAGPCAQTLRSHLQEIPGAASPAPVRLQPSVDGREVFRCNMLSRVYLKVHQAEDCLDTARKLIRMRPQQASGYLLCAEAARHLGRFAQAREMFQKAIELGTDALPSIRFMRYLQERGDLDRAQAVLDEIWQRSELRPFLAMDVSSIFEKQGDLCMEYLNQALQVNPHCVYTWAGISNCRVERQEYGKAIEAMNRAVELSPERTEIRYPLIELLCKTDRLDEVEPHFQFLLDEEQNDPKAYFAYAKFLSRKQTGTTDKAPTLAQQALDLPEQGEVSHHEIKVFMQMLRSEDNSSPAQEHQALRTDDDRQRE
jgi:hypothetical protein